MVDQPWVVLGAGGHARSLTDVLRSQSRGPFLFVTPEGHLPHWVPPASEAIAEAELRLDRVTNYRWLLAVGDNSIRERFLNSTVPADASLPPLIADSATIAGDAVLGRGVVVLEHAHIGSGAIVGEGTIINTAAVVEHDAKIGPYVHVAPHSTVLGSAQIGARSLVGAGCIVLPALRVGQDVKLGAGCVVIDDVRRGVTAVGLPARVLPSTQA